MELRSLLLNNKSWQVRSLGEKAWLLEPEFDGEVLAEIHKLNALFEKHEIPEISETVPAYRSIALIFKKELKDFEDVAELLEKQIKPSADEEVMSRFIEVPVCYDLGLDWEEVSSHTGLQKEEIIKAFESADYPVAMMGFLPGFIFLDGLDASLSVPRRSSPRTKIPSGSVGIGGSQTGIYSIESPGGWNIIGRTPHSFFDLHSEPPMKLKPGDRLQFKGISKDEFFKLSG